MKDYKINGKVIDITLDNGKVVKCATEWVEKSMKALDTDIEDVLLMFLYCKWRTRRTWQRSKG